MILPTTLYHRVLTIAAIVVLLILIGASLAWCSQRGASQKRDAVVAKTTGRALDKVVAQTPIIRNEQKVKENEVAKIEGADERLPDGFGVELERVRRNRH